MSLAAATEGNAMPQVLAQADRVPKQAKSTANQEILEIWHQARKVNGGCPHYEQFNLNTLSKFSESLMILSPLPDHDFYYTYFGTSSGLDRRMDMTGKKHSSLQYSAAAELAKHFTAAIESGEPILVVHDKLRNKSVHTWENVIMPVDSQLGRIVITNIVPLVYDTEIIQTLMLSSPTAILTCGLEHGPAQKTPFLKILLANQASERLFGRDDHTLAGENLLHFMTEASREVLIKATSDVISTGISTSVRLELADSGDHAAHDATLSAFADGIILTFAARGALGRAHSDLERREQELAQMKAELGRQAERLASFAEEINHARTSYDQEVGERRRLENELRRLADTDELTGLLNRRAFFGALEAEIKRSARYGHTPSLLYLDIDRFKLINDSRGHAAGDAVIREAMLRIVSVLRQSVDVVGRLGGDEFAVLLPETGLEGAKVVAERIRGAVAETPVVFANQSIGITVSIGIAAWKMGCNKQLEQVDEWVARADSALYQAKNAGRNAVHSAEEFASIRQQPLSS